VITFWVAHSGLLAALRRLLLAVPLAFCAGAGTAPAAALPNLTIAVPIDLMTLDGSQNVSGWHRWVFRNLYDPLVTRDANGKIVGALATSWERIDDTTWRFHLRPGVKFQNGEPFDAESVRYTLEQAKQPKSQSHGSFVLLREAKVIDANTVDIITESPVAYTVELMADTFFPVPPKYREQVGAEAFASNPVGTGAYRFVSWRRGDRIVLAANKDWWGGQPKTDQLTFWVVPDASTRVSAVLNGEANIAAQIPPLEAARFKSSEVAHVEASKAGVQPIWGGLIYDRAAFKDRRVREAVNYAVNRQAIVDRLLRGYGKPTGQMCTSDMPCYDPAIAPFPYDPDKARALLKEAGVSDLSITLNAPIGPVPQSADLTQIIAADLKKVGINARIQIDEQPIYSAKLYDVQHHQKDLGDIFLYFFKSGPGSETTMRSLTNSKGDWNWSHYHSAKVDALWSEVQKAFDDTTRAGKLREISAQVRADVPWLFLYEPFSLWAVNNKLVWHVRSDDLINVQDIVAAGAAK
jgi:peptide/nickel transport system substrate-binding protein